MALDATRRGFFRVVAGAAALPIVAKLPAAVARRVQRLGAYATVQLTAGAITSVTIINAGHGYTSAPMVTFTSDGGRDIRA